MTDPDAAPPPPVSDGWMLLGYLGIFGIGWLVFAVTPWTVLVLVPLVWAARRSGTRWRKIGLGMAAGLGFVVAVFGACGLLAGSLTMFR